MKTLHLSDSPMDIAKAGEILQKGGLVAIPTETVYGLAANAFDERAVADIFKAKGRPQDNPLIVHISNMEDLGEIAENIPEIALECAKRFWPGPFTMVLPKTDKIGECISPGLDTVAVRMPENRVALEIIEKAGVPLAAPSANTSGSPSPTTALHVKRDLEGKIDAIVYSGECKVGVESTVVSFAVNPPRLLRPGAVTLEQLREAVPDIVADKAILSQPDNDRQVASPGMKYKHYSPKTEAFLVEGEGFAEFVNSKKCAAALCFKEEQSQIKIPTLCYGDEKDETTLAHSVFAALRQVDEMNVQSVYIHAPSKKGIGLAVYNRLIRAAGFRVIEL